jgi:hypothetical protein
MTVPIHFTDADWQRIIRDWSAWWAGELDRPLLTLEVKEETPGDPWVHLTRFGLEPPVEQVLDKVQGDLEATHWLGDAYPKWWVNCGPGVVAAFLGSQPSWRPDTTWFSPLAGINGLRDVHLHFDPGNPWWQRVYTYTQLAVERWGDRLVVGLTDLGGNLDILASLRGSQNLLLDLGDAPDEVDRLVSEITPLWLKYYDELHALTASGGRGNACWAPLWSPAKGYMLQSDFSYMISPRMFERFVMPDICACCDHLDYAFYHLDGKGQLNHLEQLLSLPRLRGIQWVPGNGQPQAEKWPELLSRIRKAGKLVQVTVNAEGALTIKKEFGGRGMVLNIEGECFTPDEGRAFVTTFEAI